MSKNISNELMAIVVKKYGSLRALADELGMDYSMLYSRFSGRTEWRMSELCIVADALNMNVEDLIDLLKKERETE